MFPRASYQYFLAYVREVQLRLCITLPIRQFPIDYKIQVGSNAGVVGMTKEHLGLALALNVPVFVVVTKIDMCPENVLKGKKSCWISLL